MSSVLKIRIKGLGKPTLTAEVSEEITCKDLVEELVRKCYVKPNSDVRFLCGNQKLELSEPLFKHKELLTKRYPIVYWELTSNDVEEQVEEPKQILTSVGLSAERMETILKSVVSEINREIVREQSPDNQNDVQNNPELEISIRINVQPSDSSEEQEESDNSEEQEEQEESDNSGEQANQINSSDDQPDEQPDEQEDRNVANPASAAGADMNAINALARAIAEMVGNGHRVMLPDGTIVNPPPSVGSREQLTEEDEQFIQEAQNILPNISVRTLVSTYLMCDKNKEMTINNLL